MIRNVKNGMRTGGQFSGGMLLSPTSPAVRLSESIRLPKGGVEVPSVLDVGPRHQHFGSRLLVVPARLNCGHLGGLISAHIPTIEMAEQDLDRDKHGREEQAHAKHDMRLAVILVAQ